MAKKKEAEIKAGNRNVTVSKADKTLFPKPKLTKEDLAAYYAGVAEYMLPYMKDRPLTLHRYPNGIKGKDFYQKEVPGYFPNWIKTVSVKIRGKGRKKQKQVVCNDEATLVYLADQACLTQHAWLSTYKKPDKPDRIIFDFDPAKKGVKYLKKAAKLLKEALEKTGLTAFVMTTGSKGFHIVSPIRQDVSFDKAREFAGGIAEMLAKKHSSFLTDNPQKSKRKGKVFIDYLRNAYGQTAVVPYSVRARKSAPVAAPLTWKEFSKSSLKPTTYRVKNIMKRLSAKGDAWKGMTRRRASLKKALKKLNKMKNNNKKSKRK